MSDSRWEKNVQRVRRGVGRGGGVEVAVRSLARSYLTPKIGAEKLPLRAQQYHRFLLLPQKVCVYLTVIKAKPHLPFCRCVHCVWNPSSDKTLTHVLETEVSLFPSCVLCVCLQLHT